MLISGIIAGGLGWEQVFYIQGGLSILWLIAWVFLSADSPEKQTLISQEERDYIINALNAEGALSKGVTAIKQASKQLHTRKLFFIPETPSCTMEISVHLSTIFRDFNRTHLLKLGLVYGFNRTTIVHEIGAGFQNKRKCCFNSTPVSVYVDFQFGA